MKITSEPAATSWAELYVADGFNFARRKRACRISSRKRLVRQTSILRKLWTIHVAQPTQMEVDLDSGENTRRKQGEKTVQLYKLEMWKVFSIYPNPKKSLLLSLQQSHNTAHLILFSLLSSEIRTVCHVISILDGILVSVCTQYPYPCKFRFKFQNSIAGFKKG